LLTFGEELGLISVEPTGTYIPEMFEDGTGELLEWRAEIEALMAVLKQV
jgi:hypothetical protein